MNVGMDRIRFELCGCKSLAVSFVFSMMIIDVRNITHSMVMFVWLCMLKLVPKCWVVMGHSSWLPPPAT